MKSNTDLQTDVQDAIKYEPLLHAAEIGVIAEEGVVTLTGVVDSFPKKYEAEDAAKKVKGVKAVVDQIVVQITKRNFLTDQDIAAVALQAIKDSLVVPSDNVQLTVEAGWITLEGAVRWEFQRDQAREAVRHLNGVKGVLNKIKLKSEVRDEVQADAIRQALRRHWSIHAENITITVDGTHVTLKGFVSSVYEREEAEKIAYKTPGVWFVDNKLEVDLEPAYLC